MVAPLLLFQLQELQRDFDQLKSEHNTLKEVHKREAVQPGVNPEDDLKNNDKAGYLYPNILLTIDTCVKNVNLTYYITTLRILSSVSVASLLLLNWYFLYFKTKPRQPQSLFYISLTYKVCIFVFLLFLFIFCHLCFSHQYIFL